MSATSRTNWAGNYTYAAAKVLEPRTEDEIRAAVRGHEHISALGSRHSFNGIADNAVQVSAAALRSIEIDGEARSVTIGAGVRYGDLAPVLQAAGFALHNLASLPHISVAGAIATATHGSGLHNGNLATGVSAIEFVSGGGEVVRLTRGGDPEIFPGAVVHLGALGVLTSVTLDLQPAFEIEQTVFLDLPFGALEDHLAEVFGAGYSVSLFTHWQKERVTQAWIKRRTDDAAAPLGQVFHGGRLAAGKMHPIADHPAEACTDQGVPGPWCDRLPHFRMDFTPSSGQELQSEYFVPLDRGCEALCALKSLSQRIAPHLLVSELRAVAADDLWMSMAYRRDSLAIHFTWKPGLPSGLLAAIESRLEDFAPRPHWGKLFTVPGSAVAAQYPRLGDFRSLAARFDPGGKFRNVFLRGILGPV